ncbi:hypothetical protein FN846DRAFT_992430 [Sphaerosporella brunnea]|uniref:Uncharacterized protein n=1 Tax=Sphaerosporella brunnea TaxID=1250544 RepID=A0A5J5EMF3_9PEZI|nr:hypothetical protein FN846DRAFT_992430 [Sphaerosporella brunnea]
MHGPQLRRLLAMLLVADFGLGTNVKNVKDQRTAPEEFEDALSYSQGSTVLWKNNPQSEQKPHCRDAMGMDQAACAAPDYTVAKGWRRFAAAPGGDDDDDDDESWPS